MFISRRISDPKRFGGSEKYWRKRDEVSYIAPLNTARLMFDVFSIFYNILDIEQQYKRFSEKLYNLATDKNANSLFNAIKDYCYNERKLRSNPPDVEWDRRWNLLSWGAIRNIDVLESVVESAKSLGKGYSGENIEHILAYLRNISAFEIKTYDITTNNDRYTITFKFLGIIKDFIDSHENSKEETNEIELT